MASKCLLYSIVNYGVVILRLVYLLHTEKIQGQGDSLYIQRRAHNNYNNRYVLLMCYFSKPECKAHSKQRRQNKLSLASALTHTRRHTHTHAGTHTWRHTRIHTHTHTTPRQRGKYGRCTVLEKKKNTHLMGLVICQAKGPKPESSPMRKPSMRILVGFRSSMRACTWRCTRVRSSSYSMDGRLRLPSSGSFELGRTGRAAVKEPNV